MLYLRKDSDLAIGLIGNFGSMSVMDPRQNIRLL